MERTILPLHGVRDVFPSLGGFPQWSVAPLSRNQVPDAVENATSAFTGRSIERELP